VSIVAGIGRAAKSGILIKGGEYLENAGKISALALDKTGTITEGKPRVSKVVAFAPQPVPTGGSPALAAAGKNAPTKRPESPGQGQWSAAEREVLHTAAIAEAGSEHPLARAVVETVGPVHVAPQFERFETRTGLGVVAENGGERIAVGSASLMEDLGIDLPPAVEAELSRLKRAGQTVVLVSRDETVLGAIGISDTVREVAVSTIDRLKALGLESITMLTGDDPATARAIAEEVGIDDVRAGLLPEDKLDAIRELQEEGHVVAMVGDGVNDAPALATADIGIAMGAAGTDIAIETADIALMADELDKLPEAIRLSKATLRNIRQNVVIALATVASLLLGVLLGKIHMAGGMLIHEVSVMIVILNGMRLLKIS
jgi:Cd2+/Zn2+-exporting ATPase